MSEGKILITPSNYVELGEIGGAIELDISSLSERIILVRMGESSYAALSPTCTHLGCTVRKEPSFFRCPCHGSTYTLEGAVVRGPAEKPLRRYNVEMNNQQIIIRVEE
jgi:Rieske Fe-S protein